MIANQSSIKNESPASERRNAIHKANRIIAIWQILTFSLGTFGAKGFKFHTKKGILHAISTVGDTVLQSKCEGQVYPLLQPKTPEHYFPASVDTYKKMPTPIQPVGDDLVDLAELLQPVGVMKALPPTTTPQVLDISDDIHPGTDSPGGDPLDNALDLASQLLAEAREATNTSTPLRETDTNPAIEYTVPLTP